MVYINNATKNIKMTRGDTAKIWTATADDVLGMVTITGQSTAAVSLSVVNLGAVMNGMIA